MREYRVTPKALVVYTVALTSVLSLPAQEKAPVATAQVQMTVTLEVLGDKRMPEVSREDVMVKQGKNRLKVTDWIPARGDRARLDLFILIDDACDKSLGSQLDDLRSFINAQPPRTSVGVGYMRNATVQMVQNFTNDHAAAAIGPAKCLENPRPKSGILANGKRVLFSAR